MRVAILGTGLIGGSLGLALKARTDSTVIAFDRDERSAARAVERGAADEAAASIGGASEDADLIVVGTPVGAIAAVAQEAAQAAKPGAVLTDVGSTKSRVVLEVERAMPDGVDFIGGHPMAGTEHEGIDAADAAMFDGAWWILTPTDRSNPDAYQRLHGILTTLGARVLALDPSAHDELMAFVSHVPHLTATALMNMVAARGESHEGLLALAAGGFRDVTRVAASNPEIWLDICDENRDAIADALDQFSGRLIELRDLVKQRARDELREMFVAARRARRGLPVKLVGGDLYEVRMPVPDRPGVLAEVTTRVGDLGINIEDLQLSHSAEGGRGVLILAIIGAAEADRVARALNERGYEAEAIEL